MAIRAHRLQTLRRIVYIDSHNTPTETLWLLTAATGRATTFHAADTMTVAVVGGEMVAYGQPVSKSASQPVTYSLTRPFPVLLKQNKSLVQLIDLPLPGGGGPFVRSERVRQ